MSRRAGEAAEAVLQHLRGASGFLAATRLSAASGLTQRAVSRSITILRQDGYDIESDPARGYRLRLENDAPRAAAVQPLLCTAELGRQWVFEREVSSTNLVAAELAAGGAPHGLVVTAEAQTQGRGRLGRTWHSPPGRSLYVSILLRPKVPVARVPQISLLTALAVRRALTVVCPRLEVKVKWPNDLWVGERKLGGILCEMAAEADQVRHVVVGVGVNVNLAADEFPADLAGRATSLRRELGTPIARPPLLAAFLNAFEVLLSEWLQAVDLGPFLAELEGCSALSGRRVRVDLGRDRAEGLATGLAPDGRLRLRLDRGGERLLSSGEAHLRGVD
jgi:BirA family transcriptional regulator, biotin operon repressor / biotin---[acetyl-CoA-carboxylase] ligase